MSLTAGLVAIKGQHLNKLPEIFSQFHLFDTAEDEVALSWEEAIDMVDEHEADHDLSQKRIAWFDNGWTILEDTRLVLPTAEASLLNISQQLETPVFSLTTQGTGNNYSFWYFDKAKIRHFFNSDGNIIGNFGTPLPQETGFNINEQAHYDDIHGVAKALGICWDNTYSINYFIIKKLIDEAESAQEANIIDQKSVQQNRPLKPWWKFW